MADRLISSIARVVACVAVVVASTGVAAQAGGVPDPTRPATAVDLPGAGEAAAPTGLQAVVLRPNGKSIAIINGHSVAVGDKVGDARLVSVSATEAVLAGPGGREVLKLAPAAEKKVSVPPGKGAEKKTRGRGESHE